MNPKHLVWYLNSTFFNHEVQNTQTPCKFLFALLFPTPTCLAHRDTLDRSTLNILDYFCNYRRFSFCNISHLLEISVDVPTVNCWKQTLSEILLFVTEEFGTGCCIEAYMWYYGLNFVKLLQTLENIVELNNTWHKWTSFFRDMTSPHLMVSFRHP
jgi:hypothetical protein